MNIILLICLCVSVPIKADAYHKIISNKKADLEVISVIDSHKMQCVVHKQKSATKQNGCFQCACYWERKSERGSTNGELVLINDDNVRCIYVSYFFLLNIIIMFDDFVDITKKEFAVKMLFNQNEIKKKRILHLFFKFHFDLLAFWREILVRYMNKIIDYYYYVYSPVHGIRKITNSK